MMTTNYVNSVNLTSEK